MKPVLALLTLLAVLYQPLAWAADETEALRTCLADHTNGKDRKELARWIFLAMSAHPEIRDFAQVSEADREASSRQMAATIGRLLTEDCAGTSRTVIAAHGQQGLFNAFKFLGELAMQELMTHEAVAGEISRYARFIDHQKLAEVLGTP